MRIRSSSINDVFDMRVSLKRQENLRETVGQIVKQYSLTQDFQKQLQECYVQENTIQSAAYKLQIEEKEANLWYYRISMDLIKASLEVRQ